MSEEAIAAKRPIGAQVRIGLSRDLRFLDITMIGIGAMVGAGIFVLAGSAARVAGPAAVLAFGINGVVTLLTAFTYAELGSAYPEAGGGYLWAKEGLPPPAGFLGGWLSWIAHAIACSLYAVGFASFVHFTLREYGVSTALIPSAVTVGSLTFSPLDKTITVAIVLFFVLVNYAGVRSTGRVETSMTLGKIAVLATFIAFGATAMLRDPTAPDRFVRDFLPEETGFGGILLAMGLTFIAFE
ncbi:MAG: APC family permease, partial [Dehalococcoidia bacterium]